ncbi:hypothetical protein DFH06DRAFT_1239095 [Mycena polygramma]|nr:hypothetical protein DFH06DRAFT_1239095 [Mycena polygramma]
MSEHFLCHLLGFLCGHLSATHEIGATLHDFLSVSLDQLSRGFMSSGIWDDPGLLLVNSLSRTSAQVASIAENSFHMFTLIIVAVVVVYATP